MTPQERLARREDLEAAGNLMALVATEMNTVDHNFVEGASSLNKGNKLDPHKIYGSIPGSPTSNPNRAYPSPETVALPPEVLRTLMTDPEMPNVIPGVPNGHLAGITQKRPQALPPVEESNKDQMEFDFFTNEKNTQSVGDKIMKKLEKIEIDISIMKNTIRQLEENTRKRKYSTKKKQNATSTTT